MAMAISDRDPRGSTSDDIPKSWEYELMIDIKKPAGGTTNSPLKDWVKVTFDWDDWADASGFSDVYYKGLVPKDLGMQPDTTYDLLIRTKNQYGWSSPRTTGTITFTLC